MQECEKIQARFNESGEIQDKHPIFLYGLNYFAWHVFWKTVSLSSLTREGIPTIDALQFALTLIEMRLTTEQFYQLINKIVLIYSILREYWYAEYTDKTREMIDG